MGVLSTVARGRAAGLRRGRHEGRGGGPAAVLAVRRVSQASDSCPSSPFACPPRQYCKLHSESKNMLHPSSLRSSARPYVAALADTPGSHAPPPPPRPLTLDARDPVYAVNISINILCCLTPWRGRGGGSPSRPSVLEVPGSRSLFLCSLSSYSCYSLILTLIIPFSSCYPYSNSSISNSLFSTFLSFILSPAFLFSLFFPVIIVCIIMVGND